MGSPLAHILANAFLGHHDSWVMIAQKRSFGSKEYTQAGFLIYAQKFHVH